MDDRIISDLVSKIREMEQGSGGCNTVDFDDACEMLKALVAGALREAASRAMTWQRRLCQGDDWSCLGCDECDQLRAAILDDKQSDQRECPRCSGTGLVLFN